MKNLQETTLLGEIFVIAFCPFFIMMARLHCNRCQSHSSLSAMYRVYSMLLSYKDKSFIFNYFQYNKEYSKFDRRCGYDLNG